MLKPTFEKPEKHFKEAFDTSRRRVYKCSRVGKESGYGNGTIKVVGWTKLNEGRVIEDPQ